jgi:hypothetical protein
MENQCDPQRGCHTLIADHLEVLVDMQPRCSLLPRVEYFTVTEDIKSTACGVPQDGLLPQMSTVKHKILPQLISQVQSPSLCQPENTSSLEG